MRRIEGHHLLVERRLLGLGAVLRLVRPRVIGGLLIGRSVLVRWREQQRHRDARVLRDSAQSRAPSLRLGVEYLPPCHEVTLAQRLHLIARVIDLLLPVALRARDVTLEKVHKLAQPELLGLQRRDRALLGLLVRGRLGRAVRRLGLRLGGERKRG